MKIQKLKNYTKIVLAFAALAVGANLAQASASALSPISVVAATQSAVDCYGTTSDPTPKSDPACLNNTTDPAIKTDTNTALIEKYINPFIKLLTVLVGLAVTFGIIYGAIEYSMSAGDPQKSSSGKNHIKNAIIALVGYVLVLGLLNFLIPGGIS